MKKLIALCTIALAAVAFTGCGKSGVDVTLTPAPQVAEAKVNDATKEYAEAAKAYAGIFGSTDAAKVGAATTKYSEASTKLLTALEGAKEEDQKKVTDWMATVGNEIAAAATKAAK